MSKILVCVVSMTCFKYKKYMRDSAGSVCVGVGVCGKKDKAKTPISRKRLEKSTLKNHSLCPVEWFSGTTPQGVGNCCFLPFAHSICTCVCVCVEDEKGRKRQQKHR